MGRRGLRIGGLMQDLGKKESGSYDELFLDFLGGCTDASQRGPGIFNPMVMLQVPTGAFGDPRKQNEDYDWDEHLEDHDAGRRLACGLVRVCKKGRGRTFSSPTRRAWLDEENTRSLSSRQ